MDNQNWMIKAVEGTEEIKGEKYKKIVFKELFFCKEACIKKFAEIKKKYPNAEIEIYQRIKNKWYLYGLH